MHDDDFEWDDAKAAENYAKHGISFEDARRVFDDQFAVDGVDDDEAYGEERFTTIGMVGGVLVFVVYTERGARVRLISLGERQGMSKTITTNKTSRPMRPMTEEEVMAAALSDPDAQPMTPEDFKRMKRTPRAKIIRRAFGLTQEEFAGQFQIPLGTLRDWEQGVAEPDQAARAYLRVIASDPDAVRRALQPRPRPRR
jgi:putative transcriptional regulator